MFFMFTYQASFRLHICFSLFPLSSGENLMTDRDDDFIFEDFARLRLKGHEGDDTEA